MYQQSHETWQSHAAASDSVVVLPRNYHTLLKLTPNSQYRSSRTGARSTRTQIDHDVFEGLPVRHWRKKPISISTAPEKENIIDMKSRNLAWPELEMPRDSHLLSEMSRNLLRAARMPQAKKIVTAPLMEDDKDQGEDEDADGEIDAAFVAKRWAVVPKDLEGPEPEYLAKRRKGLPSIHTGTAQPMNGTPRMRKTKIRKYDANGNSSVLEVLIPDGQTLDGELLEEETSPIQVPAPGTVVEGVGIVNAEGLVVADEKPAPSVNKRRPPPPKRKPKVHRGRRKKVAFAGADGMPTAHAPDRAPNGVGQIEGQATDHGLVKDEDTTMADEGSEEGSEGEEGEDGEREEGELSSSRSSSQSRSKSSSPPATVLRGEQGTLQDSDPTSLPEMPVPPEVQVVPPPVDNADAMDVQVSQAEVVDKPVADVNEQDADAMHETMDEHALPSAAEPNLDDMADSTMSLEQQSPEETSLRAPTETPLEIAGDPHVDISETRDEQPAETRFLDNEVSQAQASDEDMKDNSQGQPEQEAVEPPLPPLIEGPQTTINASPPSKIEESPHSSNQTPIPGLMPEAVPDALEPMPEVEAEHTTTSPKVDMVEDVQQEQVGSTIKGTSEEDVKSDVGSKSLPQNSPHQPTPDIIPETLEQPLHKDLDNDLPPATETTFVQEDPEPISDLKPEPVMDPMVALQSEPEMKIDPTLEPAPAPTLVSPYPPQVASEPNSHIEVQHEPLPGLITAPTIETMYEPVKEPVEQPVERKFSFTRPTSSPKAPTPSPPTPIENKFALRPPYYSPKAPTMSPPTPINRSMPGSPDEMLDDFQLPPQIDSLQEGDLAPAPSMQQIRQTDRMSVEAAPEAEPQMNAQIPVDHNPLDGMAAPKLGHESQAGDQSPRFSDGEEDLLGGLERSLNQRG